MLSPLSPIVLEISVENVRADGFVSLLRFWKRAGYIPLYVRQTASDLTGEHTCVMLRGLNSSAEGELEWLGEFAKGSFESLFFSPAPSG